VRPLQDIGKVAKTINADALSNPNYLTIGKLLSTLLILFKVRFESLIAIYKKPNLF
jgi:hypothetical protein